MKHACIVGGGLTGCTVARALAESGARSTIFERADVPGGLVRSAKLEGVLYEPHGSHIFHTEDEEVWNLADTWLRFRHYEHRVDILADGRVFNWPLMAEEIREWDEEAYEECRQGMEAQERGQLDLEARAKATDFEDWCLQLMGRRCYDTFIRPYTEKQWARPARELPATFAPRRVQVRFDGDRRLFKDPHQGWPGHPDGYTALIEGLLDHPDISVQFGVDVDLPQLTAWQEDYDAFVVTAPLDEFCGRSLGGLDWRGILVRSFYLPQFEYAQSAMVVNYPGPEFPFIRVHEAKHASGQECQGTVLGVEFTGAPTRYYPIETPENRALNEDYKQAIVEAASANVHFAGRLADYAYYDMDDCIRSALDRSGQVLETLGLSAADVRRWAV